MEQSWRKFDHDGARPVPHLQLVSPVVHWNRHTHYWSLIDVGGAATPTSPQSDMQAHYHIARPLIHLSIRKMYNVLSPTIQCRLRYATGKQRNVNLQILLLTD